MPNNLYARGANFERKVKSEMEAKNYLCIRSAGSHSAVDVVCIKLQKGEQASLTEQDVQPEVILIQCGAITAEKKRNLDELCRRTGNNV